MIDTLEPIRILVGDKLAPEGLQFLEQSENVRVDVKTGLSEDELTEIVGEYDGMVIRSGVQVTAKVLARPGRLRAIARAGVGVDNIDLDAATKAGVLVMNSAEASTVTTAEHAMALLLALARNIGPAYHTMINGGWDRSKFVGTQLSGKTLGIVGFGRIGQTVAQRALAFDMKVMAFDPVFNAETALDGRVTIEKDFDAMIEKINLLSFHCPLNDHTRGMLNADRFSKARDGLLVINAARGGIIDEKALLDALDSGKCGGAAIDVYENEPLENDSPLRGHPKILHTPHLGASTSEAQTAVSREACVQLLEYLRGEGIRGAVNASGVRLDLDPQQLRYVDLSQRMARLLEPMCDEKLEEITVTIYGEQLSGAASTIERMALVELLNARLDMPVNVVNVPLITKQRGLKVKVVLDDSSTTRPWVRLEVNQAETKRFIMGSVYADGLPRVLQINGYYMDIVPAGEMLWVLNNDRPGMIGMVGNLLGDAKINIADMAISRKDDRALMVLKLDAPPEQAVLKHLKSQEGILKVERVTLDSVEPLDRR